MSASHVTSVDQFGPTYYHGSGEDRERVSTGDSEWDDRFFVSHDPKVAGLYGPDVREVEMHPSTKVKTVSRWANRGAGGEPPTRPVDVVRQAAEEGFDVVEFHEPHDLIGHVIVNEDKIIRGGR